MLRSDARTPPAAAAPPRTVPSLADRPSLAAGALAYAAQLSRRRRWIAELRTLLSFPSVSDESGHRPDLRCTAIWLAHHLQHLGLQHAAVLPGPSGAAPSVYADWLQAPGQPTLLLYGHFDVQPPGPLSAWHTPPFQPTSRGNDLHARGASDDKGQFFIHLKAIESYLATSGTLPVNIKVWLEGEEEIGSPNLPAFLARHGHLLRADGVLISDTEMPHPDRPSIIYGLRGNLVIDLEVRGANRDLHSGRYGGAVANPLQILCRLLAALHDRHGRIAIPGFYDSVRPVSPAERALLRRHGPTAAQLRSRLGVPATAGEPGFSPFERTTIRPALIIQQLHASGQGAVIPARARARIALRLVPDQEPARILDLMRRHLLAATPPSVTLTLSASHGSRPVLIDRQHPLLHTAARAVRRVWRRDPIFIRSGGSITLVGELQRRLDAPIILLGFGLPDDNVHGPNEKLSIPTFFRGVDTVISFLAECAR